jgi:hypothetical protein
MHLQCVWRNILHINTLGRSSDLQVTCMRTCVRILYAYKELFLHVFTKFYVYAPYVHVYIYIHTQCTYVYRHNVYTYACMQEWKHAYLAEDTLWDTRITVLLHHARFGLTLPYACVQGTHMSKQLCMHKPKIKHGDVTNKITLKMHTYAYTQACARMWVPRCECNQNTIVSEAVIQKWLCIRVCICACARLFVSHHSRQSRLERALLGSNRARMTPSARCPTLNKCAHAYVSTKEGIRLLYVRAYVRTFTCIHIYIYWITLYTQR